jgi:hypothetical protein
MIWYWHTDTGRYRVISVRILDKKDILKAIFSNIEYIGKKNVKIPEHLDNEVKNLYISLTNFFGHGGLSCQIPDSNSIAFCATRELSGEMSYFTSYSTANFDPQVSFKIIYERR